MALSCAQRGVQLVAIIFIRVKMTILIVVKNKMTIIMVVMSSSIR